jgi:hypothetical protein
VRVAAACPWDQQVVDYGASGIAAARTHLGGLWRTGRIELVLLLLPEGSLGRCASTARNRPTTPEPRRRQLLMSPEVASLIFAIGLLIGFAVGYGVRASKPRLGLVLNIAIRLRDFAPLGLPSLAVVVSWLLDMDPQERQRRTSTCVGRDFVTVS